MREIDWTGLRMIWYGVLMPILARAGKPDLPPYRRAKELK
jgi:hypothetical protein